MYCPSRLGDADCLVLYAGHAGGRRAYDWTEDRWPLPAVVSGLGQPLSVWHRAELSMLPCSTGGCALSNL
jgi:hypothetical protein